jgi:LysM repeat protein
MSISYDELKNNILSEDDLLGFIHGSSGNTTEPSWTIVKYVVRSGDTVDELSTRFAIPRSLILQLNALSQASTLRRGQVLLLPEPCA